MKLLLSSFIAALVATQVAVSADDSLRHLARKPHTIEQTQHQQSTPMLTLPGTPDDHQQSMTTPLLTLTPSLSRVMAAEVP